MKISIDWLREWVDVGNDFPALAHALTMAGFEVEAIESDGEDRIFEINLTPNRGDCMSVCGIAREVAAIRGVEFKPPADIRVDLSGEGVRAAPASSGDTLDVRLQAAQACPKFVGRVLRGIRADVQSPMWLCERLRRSGVRPISVIVDVTNYVMLELGQPMHAYDLRRLQGAVVVRWGRPAERLELLDGRTVDLAADVLVIADEAKALGLAGVMGGAGSSIGNETADVFLEVAYFEPNAIAGRGRRYGLVTDASQRFERGVDPLLQERAMERASELIRRIAGGTAGPAVTTGNPGGGVRRPQVPLRLERVRHVLGVDIDSNKISSLLDKLGFIVNNGSSAWQVSVPSWRFDVSIEEDLIEEIARLYGFDRITEADPMMRQQIQLLSESRTDAARLADLLADRGYFEAVTYSFTSPGLQASLFPNRAGFALTNPISADLAVMRVSLWPGLIQALRENQRRQQAQVRLFESGRVFTADGDAEIAMIGGIAGGRNVPEQWGVPKANVDFYDVKADVEALLYASARPEEIAFEKAEHSALHPGQSAKILRLGRTVGWLGALHPAIVRRLDLTYGAVVFELEIEAIAGTSLPQLADISKFPAIRRDVALVVGREVTFAELHKLVSAAAGGRLHELRVFDIYQGAGIEKDKKSIALGLNLQDTSRTLTDDEADAILAQVTARLRNELQATIRDK